VTREKILWAINRYRPFGRGISTDDLIVATATAKLKVRRGRIMVTLKSNNKVLYDGRNYVGSGKESNWMFLRWIEQHSDGKGLVAEGKFNIPDVVGLLEDKHE